jgi:hypothetical protein
MNNSSVESRLPPTASAEMPHDRQPFHKPSTAMGAAGHWIETLGILAPLVISEFVKDPGRKWRAIRISALATALLSEAMWTQRIRRQANEQRER